MKNIFKILYSIFFLCFISGKLLSADNGLYEFYIDFDKIKDIKQLDSLSNVKVHQSSKAICGTISDKFPKRGKVLEFNKKAGKALGCDIRFAIPPSVKVTAEVKLYLTKESSAYFQSGLLALRSDKKYATINILPGHRVLQHYLPEEKRMVCIGKLPTGKWIKIKIITDCKSGQVEYSAVWDEWRWKKSIVFSTEKKFIDCVVLRSSWRKKAHGICYMDNLKIASVKQ